MRNILFAFMFVLLCIPLSAQSSTADVKYFDRVVTVDFGTVANSVDEYAYVSFDQMKFSRIDSISVTAIGTGELDIDSVDFYMGNSGGGISRFSGTALTQAVTINVNAGVSAYEHLLTSGATRLSAANIRGANLLKIQTRGAASGNDATDPNQLVLVLQFWGQK